MASEKCFILGNGPSLNDIDLSFLQGEKVICCNWFVNSNLFDVISPDYYCAYDSAFIEPKINPDWLQKIQRHKNDFVFPKNWQKLNLEKSLKGKIWYLDLDLTQNLFAAGKEFNPFETLWDAGNVIVNLGLPFAIQMGFEKIYLLGVDNSYYPNGVFKPYFYNFDEHKTSFDVDENKNEKWLEKSNKAYLKVYEYVQKAGGIEILNCSSRSTVPFFKKVSLDV